LFPLAGEKQGKKDERDLELSHNKLYKARYRGR